MATKKAMDFKSEQAYKNWVKAAHSIPSKSRAGLQKGSIWASPAA